MNSQKKIFRTYLRDRAIVFRRTKEVFGGLSNMAPGFEILIGRINFRTSEALYQACKFPFQPRIQEMIINEYSPMTAKMKVQPYLAQARTDWEQIRIRVMKWCLRAKLATNWQKFGDLLLATGNKPIVEDSRHDRFWGAVAETSETLVGENVLGRLLMELREILKSGKTQDLEIVRPPEIRNFYLLKEPIPTIVAAKKEKEDPLPDKNMKQLTLTFGLQHG